MGGALRPRARGARGGVPLAARRLGGGQLHPRGRSGRWPTTGRSPASTRATSSTPSGRRRRHRADLRPRDPGVRMASPARLRPRGVSAEGPALRALRGGRPRAARVLEPVRAVVLVVVGGDRHRARLEAPRPGRAPAARRLPRHRRFVPGGGAPARRRHRPAHPRHPGADGGARPRGDRHPDLLLDAGLVLDPAHDGPRRRPADADDRRVLPLRPARGLRHRLRAGVVAYLLAMGAALVYVRRLTR